MQVVVVPQMRRDLGRLDDGQTGDRGERSGMPREVREQLLLGEEHRRVALFCRPAKLDAEQAAVQLVVDVLCCDVALREEAESEPDISVVVVDALCSWALV